MSQMPHLHLRNTNRSGVQHIWGPRLKSNDLQVAVKPICQDLHSHGATPLFCGGERFFFAMAVFDAFCGSWTQGGFGDNWEL